MVAYGCVFSNKEFILFVKSWIFAVLHTFPLPGTLKLHGPHITQRFYITQRPYGTNRPINNTNRLIDCIIRLRIGGGPGRDPIMSRVMPSIGIKPIISR